MEEKNINLQKTDTTSSDEKINESIIQATMHKFCAKCNSEVDNAAIVCPACGEEKKFIYDKDPKKEISQRLLEILTISNEQEKAEMERISKIENPFIIKNKTLLKYEGIEENIVIPEGIEIIGKSAFYNTILNKKRAKTITIPSSVKVIKENAFTFCYNLEKIYIPDSVKTIEERAFSHCKNLTEVHLPNNLETIPDSCFSDCISLKKINIPDTLKKVGFAAFFDTNMKNIYIPKDCECSYTQWNNTGKDGSWESKIKHKK